MILGQGRGKHGIPDEVYDILIERYGTKPGIQEGTYYMNKNTAPTLIAKSKHGCVPENMNVLRIAGRDGSYEERYLTDGQLAAVKAIIDQMPDPSETL